MGVLAACKLRFHNHCGKQPECALHRRCTLLLAITASLTPPVMGLCRRAVLFVCPARHDLQRIVGQWPLPRLGLIPRCAHPDVPIFLCRQDQRHRLGVYWLDDRVWRRRPEAVDEMRAKDTLPFGTAVPAELAPTPPES